MKIGKYELISLEAGRFALDGGAMFGVVPKVLWEKKNPPDEKNRIDLASRCLILKSDKKIILIDTGIGSGWDEKFVNIYKIDHSQHTLVNSLAKHHISPKDVSDVILTHLHFDHTGGTTYNDGNTFHLTFPNAVHHVQEEHWEWAMNPLEKDRASFIREKFLPLEKKSKINKLNSAGQLFDHIEVLVMYGHTQGMQLVKIHDENTTVLYCSDLIPTASHLPVPWVMGYDNNPLTTIAEKNRILPIAVQQQWILFFEHDPFLAAGYVKKTDKGFTLDATVTI